MEEKITQASVDLAALCGFIAGMAKEGPTEMQWMLLQKRANNILDMLHAPEMIITGSPMQIDLASLERGL